MYKKELYHFTTAGDQNFYYTSSDNDVEYDGTVYVATPLSRSEIESKNDVNRSDLTIHMDISVPFVKDLIGGLVENNTTCEIIRVEYDYNFNTVTSDMVVSRVWRGRYAEIVINEYEAELTFTDNYSKLSRIGNRRVYSRLCPFVLYGHSCGVQMQNFTVNASAVEMYGNNVIIIDTATADSYASGWFTGGVVAAQDGSLRFILRHNYNVIIMSRRNRSIEEDHAAGGGSAPIVLYPGCDRLRATCDAKFSNVLRFGGFPYMTTTNPFTRSLV